MFFFNDILDFEAQFRSANCAFGYRETAHFRILERKGANAVPPGTRRFACYIDVCGVDQLYAELKPKLGTLLEGDVYDPVKKRCRQRELLALAPDGNMIAFGQAIVGS